MKSLNLVSKDNRSYQVTIPDPKSDLTSAYVFSFVRSGSTLLNNMVSAYCSYIEVPTFSLFNSAFDQGIHTQYIQEDAAACFEKMGYIYTGFRHFPAFDLDVKDAPAIWLVRDPRDIMVSLYYSVLKSHLIPGGITSLIKKRKETKYIDINQFVINESKSIARQFKRYNKMLVGSNLKIYRYEDVIYNKEKWMVDVLARLGIEYNLRHLRNIVKHFDVIPIAENENKHVRQVHPGNHIDKLTPHTIQILNRSLSDFLKYFDYEH